jgi:hypothetical protein
MIMRRDFLRVCSPATASASPGLHIDAGRSKLPTENHLSRMTELVEVLRGG